MAKGAPQSASDTLHKRKSKFWLLFLPEDDVRLPRVPLMHCELDLPRVDDDVYSDPLEPLVHATPRLGTSREWREEHRGGGA